MNRFPRIMRLQIDKKLQLQQILDSIYLDGVEFCHDGTGVISSIKVDPAPVLTYDGIVHVIDKYFGGNDGS